MRSPLEVVLFSGGRGSGVLSRGLIARPQIRLTLAINGYDDGHSTGEVRRLLGDCLGPSDFRKNASRMARALGSCTAEAIELLDLRLPPGADGTTVAAVSALLRGAPPEAGGGELTERLGRLAARVPAPTAAAVAQRLDRFEEERKSSDRAFRYGDCSLGNLVFAGGFLLAERRFNPALDAYCALLGLPAGLVDNVTDGTDAYLVAVDRDGRLLASEAEIVDDGRSSHIAEIHLVDRPPTEGERRALAGGGPQQVARFLAERQCTVRPNPRVLARLAAADLVVYAPGTQHSSLFPSYLTPGVGPALAANWKAFKVLITNLRQDAEIPDASALDIVARALYYLRGKDLHDLPSPCLVTHYLIHEPGRSDSGAPYVPLGRLRTLEDPRLVRIGDFEDRITGRHDAEKVLTPFIDAFVTRREEPRVAVLLLATDSRDMVAQSVLEALRAGLGEIPAAVSFFYTGDPSSGRHRLDALPVPVIDVGRPDLADGAALLGAVAEQPFDYTVLFDSSGAYRGDEIVNLLFLLGGGRLDAVWGSRRLSLRDVRASYRQRYRRKPLRGAVSYLGSHLLSLAYLALYGRYVSDTLSGVRAVRTGYLTAGTLREAAADLDAATLNHRLLSALLRHRGEILETPVRFVPMAPRRVQRITVGDGLRSLAVLLAGRLGRRSPSPGRPGGGRHGVLSAPSESEGIRP